jgi:cellulose/xylan binding protein with CBM9 domain
MKLVPLILIIMVSNSNCGPGREAAQSQKTTPLLVRKCADFDLTGKGDNNAWTRAEWNYLEKLDSGGKTYASKFKILYSSKGIYVFFSCDDDKISTQYDRDFGNLFNGDVVEVFFHTDPHTTIYFEYEVNQLNKELVLLVPNINGKAHGWIPWHYENERIVRKMVTVSGGENVSGAAINSWNAELFFPYELFSPLANVPPMSGMIWNANFYRLDYDSGTMIKWAWSPVEKSFHELQKFRSIKFE